MKPITVDCLHLNAPNKVSFYDACFCCLFEFVVRVLERQQQVVRGILSDEDYDDNANNNMNEIHTYRIIPFAIRKANE